jgi:hypothetical protein
MNLAFAYKTVLNYRKALEQMVIVSNGDPTLSDPHYGMGDIYYDLALLDMLVRKKFSSHDNGALRFEPDATTRLIFGKAMEEYSMARSQTGSLTVYDNGRRIVFSDKEGAERRFQQASVYISGAPENAIFTLDQEKAYLWLTQLAKDVQQAGGGSNRSSSDTGASARKSLASSGVAMRSSARYWLGRIPESSHHAVRTHRPDMSRQLDAAIDLAWSLVGWTVVSSALSDGANQDAERAGAGLTTAIAKDVTVLGLSIDHSTLPSVRGGRNDPGLLMDQIATAVTARFGPGTAVRGTYLITISRALTLNGLSSADPSLWQEFVYGTKLLDVVRHEARALGMHDAVDMLTRVADRLIAAVRSQDVSSVDTQLGALEALSNAILVQRIRSGS